MFPIEQQQFPPLHLFVLILGYTEDGITGMKEYSKE